MQTHEYDVAILGGGHNGLVCAAYLAKAGLDVIVVEKNAQLGGAAVSEEFAPGYRNSVASYTVSLLNPRVISELELARHGLRIVERPVANYWPIPGGPGLVMPYGLAGRQQAVAAFSTADAARLPAYDAAIERAAAMLRDLVLRTPPNAGDGLLEIVRNAGLGRRLMGLGLAEARVLVDLFTRSARDFLDGWFENDHVKAAFAFDGVVGGYAGPSTPGTAYVLLHHCFGEVAGKPGVWGHAIGGMGAISEAIAAAARRAGAVLRTGSEVGEIEIGEGRARALLLRSGERIAARRIALNIPPKLAFRDLVAKHAVGDEVAAPFRRMTTGSGTFRMNVALSELPDFTGRPGLHLQPHHGAGIVIGPTLDYLDQAYFDARQHGWSRAPVVEILIPSTVDPTLAPSGRHVASLFVQHVAPRLPSPRSWADRREREAFADRVISTVSEHAPNFAAAVTARQCLSPLDLETRFGLVDGDIFHGQLTLGQMFSTRPVLGSAAYRLPVSGLYLCGSGAHPGGGVTGAPGRNAARTIVRDAGRRWRP